MRTNALACSALVATLIVGLAPAASADEGYAYHRYDRGNGLFSLGAAFNYGIWTGSDQFKQLDGDVNPFGPALGIMAGVTLKPGLYLGADFNYFWGGSRTVAGLNAGASVHANVYDVLGEVGYDVWVGRMGVLRPKIGLGIGIVRGTFCGSTNFAGACATDSKSGFTIAPGAEYVHFFGPGFLSLEAKWEDVMLSGPDASAVVLGIGLGAAL
jgi:hypothetical protein